MKADSDGLWTVSQEVFNPAAGGWGEAKVKQFIYQDVWDDGVEDLVK